MDSRTGKRPVKVSTFCAVVLVLKGGEAGGNGE